MSPLAEELSLDPLARGYDAMTVEQIVESLAVEDRPYYSPIPSTTLRAWSGAGATGDFSTSRFERVESARTSHPSGAVRGACKVAFLMISIDSTVLDLSLPDRQEMLGAMVAGGVLSEAEQQELLGMATQLRSRAAERGLGECRTGEVQRALEELADA